MEKNSKEWADKLPADLKGKLDGAVERARQAQPSWQRTPLPEYLDLCAAQQALCHKTEDHAEALAAFLEQRRPGFRGL